MKHAIMIMLHNNYDQAMKLLRFLDKSENHFFIHVDKKSIFSEVNEADFRCCVKEGQITFVERVFVQWGVSVRY